MVPPLDERTQVPSMPTGGRTKQEVQKVFGCNREIHERTEIHIWVTGRSECNFHLSMTGNNSPGLNDLHSSSYDLCVRDRDEIQFSWVTFIHLSHQTTRFLPAVPHLIHFTSSNLCNKWVRGLNRQQMPSQHNSDSSPWQSGKNHMRLFNSRL